MICNLLIRSLLAFTSMEIWNGKSVKGSKMTDTDMFTMLLEKGYDWRVRPPGTNLSIEGTYGPVIVRINMLIRSISKIDDVNMEYSTQLTFRESWVDGRLAYGLPNDQSPAFLVLPPGQKIWMPDTFFQNEKKARKHTIDKPNVLIRIYKDGQILYSVRISLVLSCPMNLKYYPMDIQQCHIDLASYAYTTDDIEYKWKVTNPIQLKEGVNSSLPSFELIRSYTDYCTSKTNTGTYSCLRTILTFRRQFSYYLLQLYIPSTMLVIVSWVSFWLDRSAVPARVTLGVTTLLTMTTQASGINAKLPPVSYTKAIDVWIGACLTFIFGALLEFAWVTYVSAKDFQQAAGPPTLTGNSSLRKICKGDRLLLGEKFTSPKSSLWTQQKGNETGGNSVIWVPQRESTCCIDEQSLLIQHEPRPALASATLQQVQSVTDLESLCQQDDSRGFFVRQISNICTVQDRSRRADYMSRFLFPFFFTLFNIIYWLTYSQYQLIS